jgi:hypothetical protein
MRQSAETRESDKMVPPPNGLLTRVWVCLINHKGCGREGLQIGPIVVGRPMTRAN